MKRTLLVAFLGMLLLSFGVSGCNSGTDSTDSAAGQKTTPPAANAPGVSSTTQAQVQQSQQSDAASRNAAAAKTAPK